MSKPKAPAGLGTAGKRLWTKLVDALEFEVHELELLAVACRQADDVAALEAAIKSDGYTVPGAAGQTRLNMAVSEVRQGRLAVGKLLDYLSLPNEDDQPQTHDSRRARAAANARWSRVRAQREAAG